MVPFNFLIRFFVNTPTWVLVIIVIIIGALVSTRKENKKNSEFKNNQDLIKDCVQYNKKDEILIINKRNPYLKNVFFIEEHKGNNFGYEEEKYVYTGATVGGVTMGGIHKTGGNYVEKYKSRKVQLFYRYFNTTDKKYEKNVIKKIRLENEELVKQAQESPIKKYLKNNNIIIEKKENSKKLNNAIMFASKIGDNNAALNFMDSAKLETLPTKEKCDEIIEWLSSCD